MIQLIQVETYTAGETRNDPATKISPSPVRSIRGRPGSNAAKQAARDAHKKLGYDVRSVSFADGGIILVYVTGAANPKFDSRRVSRRRRNR